MMTGQLQFNIKHMQIEVTNKTKLKFDSKNQIYKKLKASREDMKIDGKVLCTYS